MSDPQIEDYARIVLIFGLKQEGWPGQYQRRDEYVQHIRNELLPLVLNYDPRLSQLTLDSLVEGLFEDLRAADGFMPVRDRFAGEYFIVSPAHIQQFRDTQLNASPIYALAKDIGFERFFSDVFAGFRQDPDNDQSIGEHLPPPPPDNREIAIEPRQIAAIQAPLDALIDEVEADNGIPEFPNFRERALGQIKAGREMILSGCVRAQLLYWVLLKALGELVEKYGQKAIGIAAARLIELLVEQVFKS